MRRGESRRRAEAERQYGGEEDTAVLQGPHFWLRSD